MKNNIKNIIFIIIFLLTLPILYMCLTWYRKPDSVDLNNIAGFYGEEENTLDVVYLGGSASFVYWEPLKAYEEHGITSYLYGANTIQAEMYEYMVREVYTKQNPELIIIDARAFQYRDIDQPPTDVAYLNVLQGTPINKNKAEFVYENVPKYLTEEDEPINFLFDFRRFHSNQVIGSVSTHMKMMTQTYENELKGFYFVPSAVRMKKEKFKTDVKTPVSEETTKILNNLIKELDKHDAKVLFIVSPYIIDTEEKENFNYISEIIANAGYDFIDSNDYVKEMKIDYDTDFYNYAHVNIFGADKYTDFLSNYINENYNLEDRREDPKYSSWNELLPNWHEEVEKCKTATQAIIDREGYYETIYTKE